MFQGPYITRMISLPSSQVGEFLRSEVLCWLCVDRWKKKIAQVFLALLLSNNHNNQPNIISNGRKLLFIIFSIFSFGFSNFPLAILRSLRKSSVTCLTKTKKARNSFASVPLAIWVRIYNHIKIDSLNKELNWIFLLRVWFIFWPPLCAVGIGALAVLVPGLLLGFLGGGFFPAGTTTDFFQVSSHF